MSKLKEAPAWNWQKNKEKLSDPSRLETLAIWKLFVLFVDLIIQK